MSKLMDEQLKLEKEMVKSASTKYYDSLRKNIDSGNVLNTIEFRCVVNNKINDVSETISYYYEHAMNGRMSATVSSAMKLNDIFITKSIGNDYIDTLIDFDKIAFSSMTSIMSSIAKSHDGASYNSIADEIGSALHDEALYCFLNIHNEEQMKTNMKRFKNNHSTYNHKSRSIKFLSENRWSSDVKFKKWNRKEIRNVGLFMIVVLEDALSDMIFKDYIKKGKKTLIRYYFKDEFFEWFKSFSESYSSTLSEYEPMIVKPLDWTNKKDGGYITIRNDLVKNGKNHLVNNIENELKVINKIQQTPWKIDDYILSVQESLLELNNDIVNDEGEIIWHSNKFDAFNERPEFLRYEEFDSNNHSHLKELKEWKSLKAKTIRNNMKRKSKILKRNSSIRIARKYSKYKNLYFVWNIDSRCRKYAISSTISPQSDDQSRSLIRFSESKEINDRGMFWLSVYVSNCFGNDKITLNDRSSWSYSNFYILKDVVKDPINHIDYWACASKPFKFLQSAKEFVDAVESIRSGKKFYTSLPIQVDGKCNGLQHYTLISRDESVSDFVGITQSNPASDIYVKASESVNDILKSRKDSESKELLKIGIDRSVCKRPVMTSVYKSTRFGVTKQVNEKISHKALSNEFDSFSLSVYLSDIISKNMTGLIGKANDAMNYLSYCVSEACKKGNGNISWTNHIGTSISQDYKKRLKTKRVYIKLGDNKITIVDDEDSDSIDIKKMSNSICANFIHSVDASHLSLTVIKTMDFINSYSLIHDDFGCLANDVDFLIYKIKESAIDIHSNKILDSFAESIESNNNLSLVRFSNYGNLNIESLKNCDYFFC